jgi:hypothetical protein
MRYGFGWGGGMGFGFRGASPPWPYVGRGRGGLPRCGYFTGATTPTGWSYPASPNPQTPAPGMYQPYAPPMSKDEELDYLNSQAEGVKGQLEEIESRIRELETNTDENK